MRVQKCLWKALFPCWWDVLFFCCCCIPGQGRWRLQFWFSWSTLNNPRSTWYTLFVRVVVVVQIWYHRQYSQKYSLLRMQWQFINIKLPFKKYNETGQWTSHSYPSNNSIYKLKKKNVKKSPFLPKRKHLKVGTSRKEKNVKRRKQNLKLAGSSALATWHSKRWLSLSQTTKPITSFHYLSKQCKICPSDGIVHS